MSGPAVNGKRTVQTRPRAGHARLLQDGTYPKNHTFSFVRSGR